MATLIRFLNKQMIPMPGIFHYIDLISPCSLSKNRGEAESLEWYLNQVLKEHNINYEMKCETKSFNKFEIIYNILLTLWSNRFKLKKKFFNLSQTHPNLIQFLTRYKQEKSLKLINCEMNDIPEIYIEKNNKRWSDVKKKYLLQVLQTLSKQQIPVEEILSSIKLDPQSKQYSLELNQALIHKLKEQGQFQETEKIKIQSEQSLINEMLSSLFKIKKQETEQLFLSEQFKKIYEKISELNLSDIISETIKMIYQSSLESQNLKQEQNRAIFEAEISNEFQMTKDLLLRIYMKFAIKKEIPFSELLLCLDNEQKQYTFQLSKDINLEDIQQINSSFQEFNQALQMDSNQQKTTDEGSVRSQLANLKIECNQTPLLNDIQLNLQILNNQKINIIDKLKKVYSRQEVTNLVKKISNQFTNSRRVKEHIETYSQYVECCQLIIDLNNYVQTNNSEIIWKPLLMAAEEERIYLTKKQQYIAYQNSLGIIKILLQFNKPLPQLLKYLKIQVLETQVEIKFKLCLLFLNYMMVDEEVQNSIQDYSKTLNKIMEFKNSRLNLLELPSHLRVRTSLIKNNQIQLIIDLIDLLLTDKKKYILELKEVFASHPYVQFYENLKSRQFQDLEQNQRLIGIQSKLEILMEFSRNPYQQCQSHIDNHQNGQDDIIIQI